MLKVIFGHLKNCYLVAGILMFFLMQPYYVWHTGRLLIILSIILAFILLNKLRKFRSEDVVTIPLFIYVIFYPVIDSFEDVFVTVAVVVSLVPFLVILFTEEKEHLRIYAYFKTVFSLILLLSLVSYVAVYLTGSVPNGLIEALNKTKGDYFQYIFLVSPSSIDIDNLRFHAVFDEPGVVGSFVAVMLYAERFKLKSFNNKILFVAGILSFSFFFYALLIIYFFFNLNFKTGFIFIIVLVMFYLTTKDNEFIESQLWDRFIYEDGNFRGDNRSGEVLDGAFNRFMESNDLLFGKGLDYASSFGEGNSSYRLIVIAYGLIFAIISIIAFTILAYSISGNLRTTIEYMVVFIGMMYQRPNLYDISYFYILVISVYVLNFTRIHKSSMTIEEYSTNILIKG